MTKVECLLKRLADECALELPERWEFQRTYAGIHQRQAGAWSWLITEVDEQNRYRRDVVASYYAVTELLKADKLVVSEPTRRNWTPVVDPHPHFDY